MRTRIVCALLLACELWVTKPTFASEDVLFAKPSIDLKTILGWMEDADVKKRPQSVEQLLARLPSEYRDFFILQYKSISNHDANFQHPRVIFYGPTGHLMFAFSGLPTDPSYNVVELIEFNPETAEYTFADINFDELSHPTRTNPSECRGCHSEEQRPNFEPYSLWPGAYGSMHDRILADTAESRELMSFAKSAVNHPRYRFLPQKYLVHAEDFNGSRISYTANHAVSLNGYFGILQSYFMRHRIAKQIVNSRYHEEYRYAITASLIGCKDDIRSFLPASMQDNHPRSFDEIRIDTENRITALRRINIGRVATLNEIEDRARIEAHADTFGQRKEEIERVARLRYLLENRRSEALPMDTWSLSLRRRSYDFNDGNSGLENLIGHYLPKAFPKEEAHEVSNLISVVATPLVSLPNVAPVILYTLPDLPKNVCKRLGELGRAAR